jgi:hypothetical protein
MRQRGRSTRCGTPGGLRRGRAQDNSSTFRPISRSSGRSACDQGPDPSRACASSCGCASPVLSGISAACGSSQKRRRTPRAPIRPAAPPAARSQWVPR